MTEAQDIPIRMYRAVDILTVAAPMAGLGVEDIAVDVTADGRLVIDAQPCHDPKIECRSLGAGNKEVLLDEWRIGPYHRELALRTPVDGAAATLTYGNGVLVVALPIAETTRPAHLTMTPIGSARGERLPDD
jgi:HSP20 family molecular chaperone IbpA